MKKSTFTFRLCTALAAFFAAQALSVAHAAVIVKANNADALNLASSWTNGVAPGANDIATWDAALTASKTYSLGADLSWLGLAMTFNPGGNLVFNSGNTLTLGKAGIYSTQDRSITFNCGIIMTTNQTWSIGANTTIPAGGVETSGHTLTLAGSGTKQFKAPITGGGDLILVKGGTKFSNGTVASVSDIVINNGTSLTFDATPATGGAARAANITIRGAGNDGARAALHVNGVSSADTVDTIANALILDIGQAYVNFNPNAARPLLLTAGNFVHNLGNHTLFRGADLGLSTLASSTAGDANVSFTNAPTLLGGGGAKDSTNVSILPGAYGNNVSSSGAGLALVTYDLTYGIRLLNTTTEFLPSVTNLLTSLDNVRIVNTTGSGIVTNTLLADATINSLSIDQTGAGTDTGVRIYGNNPARVLTLASGTIFSRQIVTTPLASDATVISDLVLNLNGQEGIILSANQNGYNQGNTTAPLYIYASITNDNGKGVTIGAIAGHNGHVQFIGSTPHTYTGPTTVNSGYFRLNKTPSNTGVPGDLILNGGVILKNNEAIPNTADLTLNGGSFYFDTSQSSGNNGLNETVNNFYMNGGVIALNSGKNLWFTINGNAVINAQDLKLSTGGDITVLGATTLNGGRVLVSLSDSTTAINAWFTFNDIVITNQESGVYSPIVLKSHATNIGGQLTLKGNLTFVGNSINENTALFDSENIALAQQGIIALDGTRTFNIGNGAAPVDVQVNVAITDNGATLGSLTKTGTGTLALGGNNLFTGGTTVSVGTLTGTGSLASDITVASGATLAPGAPDTIGTFTVNANVDFEAGSTLDIDIVGATADLLAVSGAVTGTVSVPVAQDLTEGDWKVMTAGSLNGTFVTTNPRWALYTRNGGTELWLTKKLGTTIIIR